MKPVINFQITEKQSIRNAKVVKEILTHLKNKLSKNYEVVFTPWKMQADNMVNIVIDDKTDIESVIRQLNNMECRSIYQFHRKYLGESTFNMFDYDGDVIHPLDAMKDWWMPVIEMCNFSKLTNNEIFDYLYMNDLNPYALVSVTGDDIDNINIDITAVAHRNIHVDLYIRWMISWINNSSKTTTEIAELMEAEKVDPFLIVSIDDNDDGFPWTILDENIRISLGSDINAQYLRAATERRKNRKNIPNKGEIK